MKTIKQSLRPSLYVFMNSLLMILCLMDQAMATGSGQETHGGYAYEYQSQGKKLVRLQDYEEGATFKFKMDFGPQGRTEKEVMKFLLDRLEKIDPVTAQRFRQRELAFDQEMLLVDEKFLALKDENENTNKLNPGIHAKKTLLILQNMNPKPGQYRYYVNRRLWSLASAEVKAGIKLHEFVWPDAVEMGHTSSNQFRSYVFKICSEVMNAITALEYFHFLNEAGFIGNKVKFSVRAKLMYTVDGNGKPLSEVVLGPVIDPMLSELPLSEEQVAEFTRFRGNTSMTAYALNQNQLGIFVNDNQVLPLDVSKYFYMSFSEKNDSFQIYLFHLEKNTRVYLGNNWIECQKTNRLVSIMTIFEKGNKNLASCILAKTQKIKSGNGYYIFIRGSEISFYSSGKIASVSPPSGPSFDFYKKYGIQTMIFEHKEGLYRRPSIFQDNLK